MLHQLEEFEKMVEITGYRSIRFAGAEEFLKATRRQPQNGVGIQFFDADLIAMPEHLYFAALNALQAFKGKTNRSKSVAVETMLYASAQRQIQRAIEHIGIKLQTQNMAVLIVGEDQKQIGAQLSVLSEHLGCAPDESVLQLTADKVAKIRVAFQITDTELATQNRGNTERAIVDLVVEHIALLSTQQ